MINPGQPQTNSGVSNFLTSPGGGGIVTTAANLLSQGLSSKSVNFRGKYERNRANFNRAQIGPDTRARVEAVKSAGLHPLAALGITPGSGGASTAGAIPGQSPDYGSAISEGIRTTQQMQGQNQRNTQSRVISGLQVQEQQLRNDFLAEQIKSSQMARMTQVANSMRPPVNLRPHPTEGEKRTFLSNNKKTFRGGPGTPQSVLEDEFGEWADYFPSVMGNVWDSFKQDFRNVFNIKPGGAGPDFLRNPPKTQ